MGKRDWLAEANSYGLDAFVGILISRCHGDRALADEILGDTVAAFVACSSYLPDAASDRRTRDAFRSAFTSLLTATPVTDDPGFE